MNKWIAKIYRFMYGRYGVDDLYRFGLGVFIFLSLLNLFLNNRVITILELIIIFLLVYRSFSKDIVKRRKENNKYLRCKQGIKAFFNLQGRKWQDRNTHLYKKCPKCKTVLRFPLKKGRHTCKCPNCKNKFTVRCFRNERVKVEVIKKHK